jgi:hypothetical protein
MFGLNKKSAAKPDELWVPTLARVGKIFRKSRSAVAAWVQKGMPGKPGAWPIHLIAPWVLETIVPRTSVASPESKESLQKEKLRLSNERARIANAKARGDTIGLMDVLSQLEQIFAALAARFHAWPEEVGPALPTAIATDVVELLTEKAELFLNELAGWKMEPNNDPAIQRLIVAATAAADAKRKARIEAIAAGGVLAPGGGFV